MASKQKQIEPCRNHPDREAWSKGLCRYCYQRDWISRQPMATCRHSDRHAYSKLTGECQDCYKITRGIVRRGNMKRLHGETGSLIYAELLAAQGGVCAVCKGTVEERHGANPRIKHFTLDHDHVSGHMRGVLCNSCNRGLGLFQDNPLLLLAAAAYLEVHKNGQGHEVP